MIGSLRIIILYDYSLFIYDIRRILSKDDQNFDNFLCQLKNSMQAPSEKMWHKIEEGARYALALRSSGKSAWVFTWLIFVIFVGTALLAWIWVSNVDEWFRWISLVIFVILAIIALFIFWRHSAMISHMMY